MGWKNFYKKIVQLYKLIKVPSNFEVLQLAGQPFFLLSVSLCPGSWAHAGIFFEN